MVAVTGRARREGTDGTPGASDPSEGGSGSGPGSASASSDDPTSTSRTRSRRGSAGRGSSGRRAAGRPWRTDPLGRYVRRPLWWLPLALFTGALFHATELEDVRADEQAYGTGDPLPAVVDDDYDGGDDIPVTYEHPLFGRAEAAISLSPWDTGRRPEPGEVIPLRADRANPYSVRLPHSVPDRPMPWRPPLLALPWLAAFGRRWWTARRAQRLLGPAAAPGSGSGVASGSPATSAGVEGGGGGGGDPAGPRMLLGRLRPRRRRHQTVVLDLFAHDAGPDARPLCTVPVVSSLGLPLVGPVFPVEVHGRPRPFGRVVARVADGALWPRRRALLLPRWPSVMASAAVADPRRREDKIDEAPARMATRRLRPAREVWPQPTGRLLGAGALLAAGLTVSAVGTLTILREQDRSEQPPPGSVEAAALVVGPRSVGLLDVRARLTGPAADAAAASDAAEASDTGRGDAPSDADPGDDSADAAADGTNPTDEPGGDPTADPADDDADGTDPTDEPGGDASGEGDGSRLVDAVVAVPHAAAWPTGFPLLVRIDPDIPTRAHLVPAPYRATEPMVWVWLPTVAAALWLGRTVVWRREAEEATQDDRWRPVEVDQLGDTTFVVSRPGAPTHSCLVTLPLSIEPPPSTIGRTLERGGQVFSHGLPAPGERVVLRFAGAVMPVSSAATLRDRPWRRRWRTMSRWLQRERPPLGRL